MTSMIARLGALLSRWSNKVVPDPFVIALWLTLIVFAVGWLVMPSPAHDEPSGATALMFAWVQGFSNPVGLAFALQMALVLISGQALALSPPVTRLLRTIAAVPKTTSQAAAWVALIACLASILHWGLGAIAGAIVAREIGQSARRRGEIFHYPLLGAAGYTGFAVFHGGFSGSAPLKVAEEGHFLADTLGVIPITQTVFHPLNLLMLGGTVLIFVALFYALAPSKGEPEEAAPELPDEPIAASPPWRRRVWSIVFGAVPGALLAYGLVRGDVTFDINTFTLLFLFAGITLHGDLERFVVATSSAAKAAGPICLQYPFYFAIVGMMQASGLTVMISELLVSVATQATLPLFIYWSAAFVNVIIPSGGGQWAVQGPIMAQTGLDLGVDPSVIVLAFSHGDASTNLMQPFWALPLLGLMGLRAGQIIGYTALACLAMGLWCTGVLLVYGGG